MISNVAYTHHFLLFITVFRSLQLKLSFYVMQEYTVICGNNNVNNKMRSDIVVDIFLLTAIGAIGALAFSVLKSNKLKKRVHALAVQSDAVVAQIDGFRASSACTIVNGMDLSGFLYVDVESKRFCIVSTNMSYKLFGPNDILDVSIVENNPAFTETQLTDKIRKALLGGLKPVNSLFRNRADSAVNTIHVVMHVKDSDHNTVMINCLPVKTQRNTPAYENAIHIANSWKELLKAFMHSA